MLFRSRLHPLYTTLVAALPLEGAMVDWQNPDVIQLVMFLFVRVVYLLLGTYSYVYFHTFTHTLCQRVISETAGTSSCRSTKSNWPSCAGASAFRWHTYAFSNVSDGRMLIWGSKVPYLVGRYSHLTTLVTMSAPLHIC